MVGIKRVIVSSYDWWVVDRDILVSRLGICAILLLLTYPVAIYYKMRKRNSF